MLKLMLMLFCWAEVLAGRVNFGNDYACHFSLLYVLLFCCFRFLNDKQIPDKKPAKQQLLVLNSKLEFPRFLS